MVVKLFFLLLAALPLLSSAQSHEVKKDVARIEGENVAGYQVILTASEEEIKNSLTRYLKALGRTKASGDYITVPEAVIGGTKYSKVLYATIKVLGNATAVWMGVPLTNGEESSLDRDLQKLVYDFRVTFQREKIQLQIDESLRALQAVEKQQVRLVNQNKDLNSKIENNKQKKIELEKSLIENKIELEDLKNKLQANAVAQDSVAIATEQIRKVVEMRRERQKQVN